MKYEENEDNARVWVGENGNEKTKRRKVKRRKKRN